MTTAIMEATSTTSAVTDTTAPRRTYIGRKQPDGNWPGIIRVLVESRQGSVSRVLRHRGIKGHSPTGFSWGYGGSGPAETAHAIMADFLEVDPSPRLYQQFKFEIVALFDPGLGWTLPDHAIQKWLDECGIPHEEWKTWQP